MSNYQNTSQHYGAPQGNSSQHYGAPQGNSSQHYGAPQGNSSQHYGAPQGNSSQHYGSPQGSTPAPTRKSGATGPAPSDIPPTYVRTVRWVYILLAFLLGAFGIHNFYAGYHKRGVIQLAVSVVGGALTGGIANIAVGVWLIYEMCVVKEDAKGVPFV